MRELPTPPGEPGRPLVEPSTNLLDRAEAHPQNGHLMAAAAYIRAAFETRLKNVCRDQGIKVAYKPDPKDVKADQLWQEIVERLKSRRANAQLDFLDPNLIKEIESSRVLNRLSHSGTPDLHSAAVAQALRIVCELQNHEFRKARTNTSEGDELWLQANC